MTTASILSAFAFLIGSQHIFAQAKLYFSINPFTTTNAVVPTISFLTTSLALATILDLLGAETLHETLIVALLVRIGFAMVVTFTNSVIPAMKKPLVFGLITGSAHVFGMVVAFLVRYTLTK